MKEISLPLRIAVLTALASLEVNGISIPVGDEQLPLGKQPAKINNGLAYVIIRDQQEVPTDFNKCGIIQEAAITIDVITKFPKGIGGKTTSELISNAIQQILNPFGEINLIIHADFKVIGITKELSQGLVENTEQETAYRKIIIYNIKINEK